MLNSTSENRIPDNIIKELYSSSNPEKALFFPKFFKTGKGEYGEGDQFLGVIVPDLRRIAKKYWKETEQKDLEVLIASSYHEVRLVSLFILVSKFEKSKTDLEKNQWVDFYLSNKKYVNNWDLVDSSAPRYWALGCITKTERCFMTLPIQTTSGIKG